VWRGFRGSDVRAVERIDDAFEADERVLVHLAKLGCDPLLPRETSHFLYFRASTGAESVAATLRADGWATRVEESDGAWLLVGRHVATVTSRAVQETRRRLEALAAEHGGFYDGWEAPV
jgi:hypothetical protein